VQPTSGPAGRVPLAGFLTVALAASLFAWLGPLSRWAYDLGISPLPFVTWRAGIGALTLGIVAVAMVARGRGLVRLADLDARARIALGVAVLTATLLNLAIFAAFERTTIALALLGFYTYPALTAAVAVAIGRERLTRPKLVALGLASAGMVLVVAGGLDAGGVAVDPVGVLLALAASVSQTVFITVSRDGYSLVPTDQAMTIVLLGTAIACLVIGLVGGVGADLALPLSDPPLLAVLVTAGALGAAVPSLLFLAGIRAIGGTRTGIVMLLEPVVGVVLAAWLLAEPIGPLQVVGGVAILGGAVIVQRAAEPDHGSDTDDAASGPLAHAPGGP
jgi:drug/metabolite transporter (DMT)-like permease